MDIVESPKPLRWPPRATATLAALALLLAWDAAGLDLVLARLAGSPTGFALRDHWSADGGPGHCFPAGHAAAGFAFTGGYFPLRQVPAPAAVRCLRLAMAAGLILGLAQQLRGAHFMSHTLWTAWLCWTSAWMLDRLLSGARLRASGALG